MDSKFSLRKPALEGVSPVQSGDRREDEDPEGVGVIGVVPVCRGAGRGASQWLF